MRISIWQEFSSNNSARFTVVGVFESAEKANHAAAEITDMVKTILEWYGRPENAEALDGWQHSGDAPPSPPEIQFAKQYDVEWSKRSLDWLWLDEAGNGPVRAFENLVFVDGTESWLGSKPANALIEKLGGQAFIDGSISIGEFDDTDLEGKIHITLTCMAPDESTAQAIHDEITAYQDAVKQNRNRLFDTPWQSKESGHYSSFDGTIRREEQKLIIENGTFFHIADGFPAMNRYLEGKGCTDIDCVLTERRVDYENPAEYSE